MRNYLSTPDGGVKRITTAGELVDLETWEQVLLAEHRNDIFTEETREIHEYDIYFDENTGACDVFQRPIGEKYSTHRASIKITLP